MPTMTLDSLKKQIQEKYEPLTIDMHEAGKFDLVQALRLGDKDYAAFQKGQREFNRLQEEAEPRDENGDPVKLSDEDQEALELRVRERMIVKMRELILIPANNKDLCQQWLDLIGNDPVALMEILDTYMKAAQVGEASASQSS